MVSTNYVNKMLSLDRMSYGLIVISIHLVYERERTEMKKKSSDTQTGFGISFLPHMYDLFFSTI